MERVIQTITQTLSQEIGRDLRGLYLYGSAVLDAYAPEDSDINLLLVVSSKADIHAIRAAFQPLWQEYGDILRRTPLVATPRDLARHMMIRPILGHHLVNTAQTLAGQKELIRKLPAPPAVTVAETLANLAHEALLASSVMAMDMGAGESEQAGLRQLRRAARRVTKEPVEANETAVDLLARIHARLDSEIRELPSDQPWSSMRTATSPLLPGLQATYTKNLDRILLVFNHLTPEQIVNIGWERLAERLTKDYQGLYVTSSPQLRLIMSVETPLDIDLRRHKHNWGMDPLTDLKIDQRRKLQHAARLPSDVHIDAMPGAYLTTPDDQLHTLIHDFQNKLLNIQLENELLSRMQIAEKFRAPVPLPGREAPPSTRVEAIFQHLRWWSEHYARLMMQTAA